jgi:PAS domain S-box-containing protein
MSAPVPGRFFAGLRRLLGGSLRRQLIVGVVMANALVMSLFVADLTERQERLLLERQTEHALAVAQGTAATSAEWLGSRDFRGLQEIVGALASYPDLSYAMLLDLQGHIVAHSDAAMLDRYVQDLPVASDLRSNGLAFVHRQTATLVDVYCPVTLADHRIGWVRIGFGQERVNRRLADIRWQGILYGISAVLLGSLIAGGLAAGVTRRFRRIQGVADAVQAGDHSQRAPVAGCDEAATLANAFNAMLDALAAREEALRDSEERYRGLFQGIHVAVVVHGPGGGVVDFNDEALGHLGLSAEQMRGRSSMDPSWHLVDADGRALSIAEYPANRVRASGQALHNAVIGVVRSERQDTVWALVNADPVWDSHGKLAQVRVVFTEITEKKRIEDELREHRQHLEEMVATRTAELARARDQADSANRAKSVFLANMSHELRTPLNAVLGFAQIMSRDPQLAAEHRHELEIIDRSGRHLLALINDVLEISRIEAGRTTVQKEAFDLLASISVVEEMIRVRAEAKGLILRIDLADDLPSYVDGDAARLRQVLINLLGNAVKFTESGEISLRVRRGSCSEICFEVSDTGPGMAAEDVEEIFHAFHQTALGTAKGEGTGLGLTISRSYVRLMGGDLTVKTRLGEGSTFSFTIDLPVAPSPLQEIVRGTVLGLVGERAAPRILVVEDQPDSRSLIVMLLEKTGFEVAEAANGLEAVEMFARWQPEFIWMDMRMPVMDGYEATRRIRAMPGGEAVRIVALTASAFHEDRDLIIGAGCDDVLSKPIDESAFFAAMETLAGVRYRYADTQQDTALANGSVDVTSLPEALRTELHVAARALDIEATRLLIERVRAVDAVVADGLAALLSGYRFDQVAALCDLAGVKSDGVAASGHVIQ